LRFQAAISDFAATDDKITLPVSRLTPFIGEKYISRKKFKKPQILLVSCYGLCDIL